MAINHPCQGRQARRYRVRTTDRAQPDPIAPNLLAEVPVPTKPDAVWAADITYVETAEGWLYLADVLDLHSRRLIGRAMGSSLATALPLAALRMALRRRRPRAGLLHHSDRGCQYASAAYRAVLADHGCIASMSRRGNCHDNATMESFWSTLKQELICRRRFATRDGGLHRHLRLHGELLQPVVSVKFSKSGSVARGFGWIK